MVTRVYWSLSYTFLTKTGCLFWNYLTKFYTCSVYKYLGRSLESVWDKHKMHIHGKVQEQWKFILSFRTKNEQLKAVVDTVLHWRKTEVDHQESNKFKRNEQMNCSKSIKRHQQQIPNFSELSSWRASLY